MILTTEEVAAIRSIKKTAILLLVIYKLDKPVTRNEIAQIIDIDPETAATHLKSLARLGLITRAGYHDGYILTTGGRQLVLRQNQDLAQKALSPVNPGTKDAEYGAQQVLPFAEAHVTESEISDSVMSPRVGNFRQESGILDQSRKISDSATRRSEEEESINLINTTSSSFLPKKEKFDSQNLPSMSILLAASNLLFGKFVTGFGLPDCPPQVVLGWLAHAYNERAGLKSPAGVAYRGIERGRLPRSQYLDHPEDYLPSEYLQAVGLEEPAQEPEIPADAPDLEDDQPNPIIEDPSIDQLVGKYTPRKAWQAVQELLRYEIPKATYDTWIANTWPMCFDKKQALMTVGAPNAYARDWLAGRITSTVKRLLTGIFNCPVDIKFENFEK